MRLLLLHEGDNVAVTITTLAAGATIETDGTGAFITRSAIPAGHKVAVADIPAGAEVRKYGAPIGVATAVISRGEHVHTHNVVSTRARTDGER